MNGVTYTYLSDGTKAAARAGGSSSKAGLRYRGRFVYDVDAGGSESLQSIAVPTGRLVAVHGSGSSVSFESDAFVSDHLGNVTAVVNLSAPESTPTDNAILEQNRYLPFGTRIPLRTQAANRYRYAGKEEQDIAGHDLHLIDFGARFYDTFSCRWNAPDPLAGKYFGLSPYNYCGNDPVNFFDPDGRTDYFSYNGAFLFNDGIDNGEMRAIDEGRYFTFEFLRSLERDCEEYWNRKLRLFSETVNRADLTDDALFNIASHYNSTGYQFAKGGANRGAQFTARNDGKDYQVIIHVSADDCKNAGFFDNSFNLINAINGHEKYHADQITYNYNNYKSQSKEQHEIDAIVSQKNHPSWDKTSPKLKKWFETELVKYKQFINTHMQ